MADNIILKQANNVGYNLAAKEMTIDGELVKAVRHLNIDEDGNTIVPLSESSIPVALSIYSYLTLQVTGQVVSNAPAKLCGFTAQNRSNVDLYVKIYDKATAPTHSDTPKRTYRVKAQDDFRWMQPNGESYAAGISLRATTGLVTGDTGDPGANALIVNAEYKAT